MTEGERILDVEALTVNYPGRGHDQTPPAVAGVTLEIAAGSTLGLVGESGSGKSTVCRSIIGLAPASGSIKVAGVEMVGGGSGASERAQLVQMVFQDPQASMDPAFRVIDAVAEPLKIQKLGNSDERAAKAGALLSRVGLEEAYWRRHPHQLSGGQRQRAAIARALILEPQLVLMDEPLSALDVSYQAQIINTVLDLQDDLGLAYLFVSHDLASVKRLSDYVIVMYRGAIVEAGTAQTLYSNPRHPYTILLMSCVMAPTGAKIAETHQLIEASEPDPSDESSQGCPYRARCWLYRSLDRPARCRDADPAPVAGTGNGGVACHFPEEAAASQHRSGVLERTGLAQ